MKTQTFDLAKLSEPKRRELLHQVWESVNRKIFPTVSDDDFHDLLMSKDVPVNCLHIYCDDGGRIVGYVNCRVLEIAGPDGRYSILRFCTNILSEYRGLGSTSKFIVQQLLRYYVSKVFQKTKVILFFTANSPASYYGVARYAREIYPNPRGETPSKARMMLENISQLCGLDMKRTNFNDFTTHYEGVEVHESDQESEAWKHKSHPAVRFYLNNCPNYKQGQALITMAPIDLSNLSYSLITWTVDLILKKSGVRKSSYRSLTGKVTNAGQRIKLSPI